ncbi:MAG: hypothetical protein PHP44_00420 [Kiritimatiellae bacterium]|nr:hypothetical protein [Kiritimatiellia bacterium]MDD4734547.1 hypothetical protein [Kiritimatiellia bacterium]
MCTAKQWRSVAVLLPAWVLAAGLSGCVLQRGVDFGSRAGRAENIPVIRVYNVMNEAWPDQTQTVLLLPPLGQVTPKYRESLQLDLQEEFQKYFNSRVVSVGARGKMEEYVAEKNLVPESGFFDFEEIKRLGELMQTDYVVCTWIQEVRPYPPQSLSLYITILDVTRGDLLIELDATFNAAEQKVVVALENYLQRRRARTYDRNSLDMMLQSPSDFHLFAISECCRAMALELAPTLQTKIWP